MRSLLAFPLLCLLAVGCDSDGLDAEVDFGDPYSIQTQDRVVPTLADGRVLVPVQYAGGCAEHTFSLRSDVTGDAATLWFHHDDGGDNCEALLTETIDAPLPAAVTAADRIEIRVPVSLVDGREATFHLR